MSSVETTQGQEGLAAAAPIPAAVAERARGEIGEFRLLRWFSITSLVAITIFSIGMALLLDHFLEQRMLHQDAELARDFVQSIVTTQKVDDQFALAQQGQPAEFGDFFTRLGAIPEVLRLNVYLPNRKLLWSTDAALIGRTFEGNEELDEAITGEIAVERGLKDERGMPKQEHVYIEKQRRHFVESYLPIYAGSKRSGTPAAVVELYRVPAALNLTIEEMTVLVWGGAAVGGLFLYLSTLSLVYRASRVMQEQRERLIEGQASVMVGEIAAAVAHSIRNPLASIRSSAELQRELGTLNPEFAAETMEHVDRIEHLVRSLLNYTRGPTDGAGRTVVAEVVEEARQRHATSFESQGKQLHVEVEPQLPAAALAPLLVAQALNSVLANALEATSRGGSVRLHAFIDRGRLCVEVSDDGVGMDAEQLRQVFKPFFTTKPRGLGMGMTLVRRILARLGGSVEIESQAGHGTQVRLYLPVLADRG